MSTERVTLKLGAAPTDRLRARAANVIFRHASTGVWVKEVRNASTRVRAREKFVDPTLVDTKAGNSIISKYTCSTIYTSRRRICTITAVFIISTVKEENEEREESRAFCFRNHTTYR